MARSRRPKNSATVARSKPVARPFPFRWLGLAAVVALLAAGGWWFLRPQPAGPVILISIDTLRADHLAAYGYTKGRTPNIDALVRDSVVFDRAYAHAPQTLPSHTSILTGQLPFEHGVRDNIGFTVKPDQVTLASLFKTKGYGAGGFVSAYVLRPETGIGRGFDVYNADLPAGSLDRPIAQITRPAPETARAALSWLSSHVDPKVFMFVHFYEPHRPYEPPERFKDLLPYDGEIAAPTNQSARSSPSCVAAIGTTAPRSRSSPITAKASATTAKKSTASFSTSRRSTCPSSSKRRIKKAPANASPRQFSTSIFFRRSPSSPASPFRAACEAEAFWNSGTQEPWNLRASTAKP